jgi:hypothetical protein
MPKAFEKNITEANVKAKWDIYELGRIVSVIGGMGLTFGAGTIGAFIGLPALIAAIPGLILFFAGNIAMDRFEKKLYAFQPQKPELKP